jgi:hypothetical protein
MPIYNLEDLRAAVPSSMRDLSDDELIRDYAGRVGKSFESTASYLGFKPRGTLAEMGRQAMGGAVVDLPKMVGQGLEYTGVAPEYGREMSQAAEARAPAYIPDNRNRGLVSEALTTGARGLAPVAATLPLAFVPGGQVIAPAAAALLFGTSSAQGTYDKVLEQTGDPQAATEAARRVGLIQGVGEGAATFVGGRAIKGLSPLLGMGERTTAGVAARMTDTSILKPFAKSMGINMLVQPSTEVAQDLGTYAVERAYGAAGDENPYEIARQSALGGAGLTMLLGPFALGGHASRARRAESLKAALGEDAPPEIRAQAFEAVMKEARRQNVPETNVGAWFTEQLSLEEQRNAALKSLEEAPKDLTQTQADVDGRKLSEVDPQAEFDKRMATERPMSEAAASKSLSSFMAAQDVGGQYQDLLARKEQGLEAVKEVGKSWQNFVGKRGDQLLNIQDVGDQARGLVSNLEAEANQQEAPLAQAMQLGTAVQAMFDAQQGVGTKADFDRIMNPDVMQPITPAEIQPIARTSLVPPRSAPFSNMRLDRPGPQESLTGPTSQLSERPVAVAPLGGDAKATPLPSAPVAGGVSSTPVTTPVTTPAIQDGTKTTQAQQTKTKKQKAPITVGSVVKINDTEVTLSQEQADAWNKAQETYDGRTRRAREIANYQDRESALRSAGMQLSAERRKITGALTAKEQQAANRVADRQTAEQKKQDEMGLTAALQTANRTNVTNNPLQAGVEGVDKKAVPGKTSLTVSALRNIRDALLNPSATVEAISDREQQIADAVRAFAKAYYKFSNAGGNMLRGIPTERAIKGENGETIYKPTKLASQTPAQQRGQIKAKTGQRVETTLEQLRETRAALAGLGKAVNGNAKDVEAIVKLVKDMVQQKLHTQTTDEGMNEDFGQEGADGIAQAFLKMDTMLSQGWRAAKDNMFQGESDAAFVRQTPIRGSKESTAAGETQTPLEKAALGYAKFGKGESSTGILGLLNYIQTHGTPFERTIAKGIFQSLYDSDTAPNLEFISKGKPYYDPKTNTVYIQRDASAAVTLHESLHGALQWYVYQNPNAPEVRALKAALKRVVNFKGELSPDAKRVQDVLKALMKDNKELDAVLELISYSNTLNDFRRALEAMDSTEAPKSFYDAAKNVWQTILTTVQRLVGVRPSVAADVIGNTFKLLEAAGAAKKGEAMGNILEAAVESTGTPQGKVNAQDYVVYNKKIAPAALSTKLFFDLVGWQRGAQKVGDLSSKLADKIRKDFPTAERYITYINSRFGVNDFTSKLMEKYKVDKNTGYQRMEQLANFVESRSAEEAKAIFDYLDGNKKALDKFPDVAKVKEIADSIEKSMAMYISELPAKDRAYFENTKFSESLLFAGNTNQVASHTFGARKLSEIIGLQHRFEETIEGFQHWMGVDKNGDVDITGPFYQVFGPNIKDPAGPQVPQGYMSIKGYETTGNPVGFTVDPSRQWRISGKKGEGYKFTSNMTAQQAILEKKVTELANAMRNTMAALANNYASRNFSKAASTLGYEDGKPTELSVSFDSLEAVKKIFGRAPNPNQVLSVSKDEAKTPQIADLYRNTNTWVLIPNVEAYGALAGKYLPGPVWSAMTDMADRKPLVSFRAYNASMRWFKKSKTVYNPGTHITNIASNVTLAMMHDIPVSTIASAAKLFTKYELNAKSLTPSELAIMSQFMNSGAMLGDYSSAEVKEAIYKAWNENLAQPTDTSLLQRLKMFTGYEKSKAQMGVALAAKAGNKLDNIASELYAAEDNVFRLAAFMKKVGELQERSGEKTPTAENFSDAGTFARKAFLDYDIDSKAVRIARQSFLPFVSWTYAIAPVMGRIALHQPWKIANVLAAYYLIDVAMASAAGDDDEETRKRGPKEIRERMFGIGPYMHIRIPFMGDENNPVYYRLGDYVPMASAAKGLPNGFMGQSWIPGAITPSGPIVSAIAGLVVGVNPYTGKSLNQPTDTEWQKFKNAAKFAYDIVTPPAISSTQLKAVNDILDEKTGITGAPVSNLAIARTFGLKMYDYDVIESEAVQDIVSKRVEREFKDAMRKAKREEDRRGYPDYEALDKQLEDLQIRMEKELDKARGGTGELD